jgi:hypothetical protein
VKTNIKINFIVAIILIIAATAAFYTWKIMEARNVKLDLSVAKQPPRICTQEAKQCSDGFYVSRTGPDCEFAACPEKKIIGNDKDKHGCIGSAGYTWCEEKQKCLRVWEEDCGNPILKDWKTYQNDKYSYELQYPSNFYLDEKESNISIDKDPLPGQGGFIGFTGEYNGDTIAVSISTSGNYLTKCENILIKKITIDSREVKICRDDRLNMFYSVIPKNGIAEDSEKMSDYVFISANGNMNKKPNTEKFFELMLSTFKFN